MSKAETCVCCGRVIPEGSQVCIICGYKAKKKQQGYWKDNCNGTFTCSVCGGRSSKMKYCGNCGAKIDNEVARCHNCKHWIYFADEKRCLCIINHIYSERDYFCGKWESEVEGE